MDRELDLQDVEELLRLVSQAFADEMFEALNRSVVVEEGHVRPSNRMVNLSRLESKLYRLKTGMSSNLSDAGETVEDAGHKPIRFGVGVGTVADEPVAQRAGLEGL